MKKLITALICIASVITMMGMSVSAANIQNEDVICYKISSLTGAADPYAMGTDEDSQITYYTYGSGDIAMNGSNIVFTPKKATSMFEAVFRENKWCVPVQEYSYLKIRYKTNKAYSGDTTTTYWMSGNKASFTFKLDATGEWEETIINLNDMGINWSSYCDDGAWNQSACLNEPKIRSFRFDFPNAEGITYEIDYVAYLSIEDAAEKFDGTLDSLTVKDEPAAAPETADMSAVAVFAGLASLAAAVVCKKKK